jgi:hypothetical protein
VNCSKAEAEQLVLNQVRFINLILEECRKRNKLLEEKFGVSYGKLIGIGSVYEEAIHSLRKVKTELDQYLNIVRTS